MPRLRTRSSMMASTCVLHGHVERRGGFVGDQEVGAGDQHHRDHDALAHAAGDLVRIEVGDALGIADVDGLEHVQRGGARGLRAAAKMGAVGLGDLLADASSPG